MIRLVVVAAALFSILILVTSPWAPFLPNALAQKAEEQQEVISLVDSLSSPFDDPSYTISEEAASNAFRNSTVIPDTPVELEALVIPDVKYTITAEDIAIAKKIGQPAFNVDIQFLSGDVALSSSSSLDGSQELLPTARITFFVPYDAIGKDGRLVPLGAESEPEAQPQLQPQAFESGAAAGLVPLEELPVPLQGLSNLQSGEPANNTLEVRIFTSDIALPWFADIMGSDSVSGTIQGVGNSTLPLRCDKAETYSGYSTYDVSVGKDSEDNTATLGMQIVAPNNGTVLKEATTKAPFGVVAIVGDC